MPKRTDIKKVLIIGSGPIVIGQACEFDYSGVQACKALREEGYEIVLVNSNPATIMTDPEFADRTYIEPLTADILREVIRRERPDALLPTMGGQTALNLAMELHAQGTLERFGVELIGAKADVIRKAEDRLLFKEAMIRIGLAVPVSGSAHTHEEACRVRDAIGRYPLVIRPGFTLGGTGGGIAYDDASFDETVRRGLFYSPTSEVLVEESVLGWKPEAEIISVLEELGIGLVPYSPLGKGFLTGTINEKTEFEKSDFRNTSPRLSAENRQANQVVVDLLATFAAGKNDTFAQIALAWLLAQKPWIVPIPGTTKLSRLEENIGAVNVKLTSEEIREITSAANSINIQGERYSEGAQKLINR